MDNISKGTGCELTAIGAVVFVALIFVVLFVDICTSVSVGDEFEGVVRGVGGPLIVQSGDHYLTVPVRDHCDLRIGDVVVVTKRVSWPLGRNVTVVRRP